jgi:hypothetical protein
MQNRTARKNSNSSRSERYHRTRFLKSHKPSPYCDTCIQRALKLKRHQRAQQATWGPARAVRSRYTRSHLTPPCLYLFMDDQQKKPAEKVIYWFAWIVCIIGMAALSWYFLRGKP